MPEEKKRFLLDNNLIHTISHLSNDKAGELFKHILAFVNNQNPTSEDLVINLAFEPIKRAIIKDIHTRAKRSNGGYASVESKKSTKVNKSQQSSTKVNKVQQSSTKLNEVQKKTDYQEIINIFNSTCIDLPKASLTDDRIKMIDKILQSFNLEQIGIVFTNTSKSDYLCGKKVEWKANLSWLLTPKNFVRVLEGNFDNVNYSKSKSETMETQWKEATDAVDKYFT
jgi:hypothetical protein